MDMHFFRSKAKKFSLMGEHRFAYDAPDFAKRAEDIGGELKKVETQASKEKLEKISQLKERARTAMVSGEKQTIQLRQFALRTNVFLTKESVKVNNVQAHIPDAMIKAEYIKTLIDRAGWGVEQKESPNVTFLRTNKDKMLADVQDDFAAFQKDPNGKFEDFRSLLEESAKLIDPNMRISAQNAESLIALLGNAGWQVSAVKQAPAAAPEKKAAPKKQNETSDTRLGIEKLLDEKREQLMQALDQQFKQFMDNPAGSFETFKAQLNQQLQSVSETSKVQAISAASLVETLYKARWIKTAGEKREALDKINPPVTAAPEKPRAAAPNLVEEAKQLKNSVLMHRSAPVGSPDWNIAANALMRLCVIDSQRRPNEIAAKLEEMGGKKTSEGFVVKDQRKMFYALRDFDMGGSLFQQGQHISDIKDSIDRSKAYETGEQNNLPHWRAMQEVKRRYELRAGAKAEITGRTTGTVNTDRLHLEQFPGFVFVKEHQVLNAYLDKLDKSYRFTPNQRKVWESIKSMLKTCEKRIYDHQPDDEQGYKKGALEDIRRNVARLNALLGETSAVPQSYEVLEAQMEKRYTQLLIDAPRFNDARFLKDCYHVAVTREETAELKTLFGNLLSTWDSSNVLEKQNMLKKFDDMVARLNKREQSAGGTGMVNRHFENAPVPSQTINQAPRTINQQPPVDKFAPRSDVPSPGMDAPATLPTSPRTETSTDRLVRMGVMDPAAGQRIDSQLAAQKELMKKPDVYTFTIDVNSERDTRLVLHKKGDTSGTSYIRYVPYKGDFATDADRSLANKLGVWITQEDRGPYMRSATIHFTKENPMIVEKVGELRGAHDSEVYDTEAAIGLEDEMKSVAGGRFENWNFDLQNALRVPADKYKVYRTRDGIYDSRIDTNPILYVTRGDGTVWKKQYQQGWENVPANEWNKIGSELEGAMKGGVPYGHWFDGTTDTMYAKHPTKDEYKKFNKKDGMWEVVTANQMQKIIETANANPKLTAQEKPKMSFAELKVDARIPLEGVSSAFRELKSKLERSDDAVVVRTKAGDYEMQRVGDMVLYRSRKQGSMPFRPHWADISNGETHYLEKDGELIQAKSVYYDKQETLLLAEDKLYSSRGEQYAKQSDGTWKMQRAGTEFTASQESDGSWKLSTGVAKRPARISLKKKESDAPNTGSEKLPGEPMSRILKNLDELVVVRKKNDKAAEKSFVQQLLRGEFGEVISALDYGDDAALAKELNKVRLPNDPQLVAQLKKSFPQGFVNQLMQ